MARELTAVAAGPDIHVELLSLFPPKTQLAHHSARPWLDRVRRPRYGEIATSLAWWGVRRPARLVSTTGLVVGGFVGGPRLWGRALAALGLSLVHARTARRLDLDHVHAHFAGHPTLAAWVIQRLSGISYSMTAHAYDLYLDQRFLARKVRDAAFVVTVSEYNRRFLAEYGGGTETPVPIVRYGIEPERYRFQENRLPDSGPIQAVCVGSFSEYKGHRYLLEALAKPHPQLERVQLDLIGSGELREELEELVERLGLGERVRFRGVIDEEAVAAALDASHLFLLGSIVADNGRRDAVPNVLIEALAAGLPIVTTRISGIPELVRDEETGLLAEQRDPDGFAEAVIRTLARPEESHRRAVAGRKLVEREFDIRRSAQQLHDLFRENSRTASPSAVGMT